MSSKDRAQQRRAQSFVRSIWAVGGLAVAAVILLIAISPKALPKATLIPTPQPRPYPVDGKTLGAADAPVLVEEYSDFQ